MQLQITGEEGPIIRLALSGALDLAGVREVELKFLAHTASRGGPALVDLSGVTFMASLGMRMLLEASRALQRKGAALGLLNPSALVEDALRAAGIADLVPVFHDEARALAALLSNPEKTP
ncbi:MAG TPA: STAS domain-containing protein [Kiritimatiellia bacterium]|nr:STAS domain-containing protein [Kiritimatiellia bacterium]HRZ11355.1 STAS domain-containing protein [Kiritimatiellia bacterium]HSA17094.1 STAS domain-containing protein [Kiritimatiellia bacterium]